MFGFIHFRHQALSPKITNKPLKNTTTGMCTRHFKLYTSGDCRLVDYEYIVIVAVHPTPSIRVKGQSSVYLDGDLKSTINEIWVI